MSIELSDRVQQLISAMTLEEKVAMLSGEDFWTTVANERLGIPKVKVSDGPNGARGGLFSMGPTAACFPVGIALAATWNTELVQAVGRAIGEDVITKGAKVLLAPTVNIDRSGLNGRNFECYSEDPHLSAQMTVAYIRGVQSNGVAACVKHFVGNESEHERYTMNSIIGERALREVYLPPFKAAVQEADVWAVMTGYNKVNGTWCSENPRLLKDILKGEWGFTGVAMSDWWGTSSPAIGAGGLDLEMPGPARFTPAFASLVAAGELDEAEIDDKIGRILTLFERVGAFENPDIPEEWADDTAEHRAIALQSATEAVVLLKNEGAILPLDLEKTQQIAVIGENARWAAIMGGGSARIPAHYTVSPLAGIAARVQGAAELVYEIGCTNHKLVPLLDGKSIRAADGSAGFDVHYFDGTQLVGEAVGTQVSAQTELTLFGMVNPALADQSDYAVRLSGSFVPETTGSYELSLVTHGQGRMKIAGEVVIDNWTAQLTDLGLFDMAGGERRVMVDMVAGEAVSIEIEANSAGTMGFNTVRIGCMPPMAADPIAAAVAAAKAADVAIVFVGTSHEWETEGGDRADMRLPGNQDEVVAAVAAANPNTVVVLNTGSPVMMPWLDDVPALAQAWFPGQESGNAIAAVLFGDADPGGRLPQTFPVREADHPAYLNYPGESGDVLYGEGVFVGYRHYEARDIAPMFPFGFGLSYTDFTYANLRVPSDVQVGETIVVAVDVTNTGGRAGSEVVQVYVGDPVSRLVRPQKELKGFAKVTLQPGETKTVTVMLDAAALAYYDPELCEWVAEAGEFEVMIGRSAADIRLTAGFTYHNPLDAYTFKNDTRLHVELPLAALLADEGAKAVLVQHIGHLLSSMNLMFAQGHSLAKTSQDRPHLISVRQLHRINDGLTALA